MRVWCIYKLRYNTVLVRLLTCVLAFVMCITDYCEARSHGITWNTGRLNETRVKYYHYILQQYDITWLGIVCECEYIW